MDADLRILMVCMGNICRSPMAEGVLRERIAARLANLNIHIDSAGTHGYHGGSPPDPRAQAAAARRGYQISGLQARQVVVDDFERFDLLLAMDAENLADLKQLAPAELHDRIRLLLDYSGSNPGGEVPDPYYGGATGFERVLDLLEEGIEGLLETLPAQVAARRRQSGKR